MRYKNVTDQELTVIGVGVVKPGEEVETDLELNAAYFAKVDGQPAKTEETNTKAVEKDQQNATS